MSEPGRHLSDDIKENLQQKISDYLGISEEDRQYMTVIFTDNAVLWKNNVNDMINVNWPLPPIPDDYEARNYDILAEMLKLIRYRVRPSVVNRVVHFYIHNNGDQHRPKAHLIFSPINLDIHETILFRPTRPAHLSRWRHLSNDSSTSRNGKSSSSSNNSESTGSYFNDNTTASLHSNPSIHSRRSEGSQTSEGRRASASHSSIDESADQASGEPAMAVQKPIILIRQPTDEDSGDQPQDDSSTAAIEPLIVIQDSDDVETSSTSDTDSGSSTTPSRQSGSEEDDASTE